MHDILLFVKEEVSTMLLSLRLNNFTIYNQEVEFSMMANMHYSRFPANVVSANGVHTLKKAVLFGPNNTGKTNFVRAVSMMKSIMLNQAAGIVPNFYSGNELVEASISFLENDREYIFEIRYDAAHEEYIYERFVEVRRDMYKNVKHIPLLLRDIRNKEYAAEDEALVAAMKVASRNNLLIYLLDTESFPTLSYIRKTIIAFASRIDIVDMNNIPIKKTIDMLKMSDEDSRRVAKFVLSADLSLEDFRYADDDEVRAVLKDIDAEKSAPQENALQHSAPLAEMFHLVSVYHGVSVPSIIYDSTGTKKIVALASYVIGALKNGRILIVDELDSSLHFSLTRAIISLFNNELNKNAQLIATVHDISLLDCQSLFRKEQIWFTHKDQDSASLYSLAEFTASESKTRGTSDLIAKYRAGVFGALPEPDLFETLQEMRNHEFPENRNSD